MGTKKSEYHGGHKTVIITTGFRVTRGGKNRDTAKTVGARFVFPYL